MNSQLEDSKSWIPQIGAPCDIRIFSLSEAESLLPIVRKVTNRAVDDFDPGELIQATERPVLIPDYSEPAMAILWPLKRRVLLPEE